MATNLQRLREQVSDRLRRQLARRRRLQREVTIEAVVGLLGGLGAGLSVVLQAHNQLASLVMATSALVACILGAFDARRIQTLSLQIRSLAHVVASLGEAPATGGSA